jgi:hypothetical protein
MSGERGAATPTCPVSPKRVGRETAGPSGLVRHRGGSRARRDRAPKCPLRRSVRPISAPLAARLAVSRSPRAVRGRWCPPDFRRRSAIGPRSPAVRRLRGGLPRLSARHCAEPSRPCGRVDRSDGSRGARGSGSGRVRAAVTKPCPGEANLRGTFGTGRCLARAPPPPHRSCRTNRPRRRARIGHARRLRSSLAHSLQRTLPAGGTGDRGRREREGHGPSA